MATRRKTLSLSRGSPSTSDDALALEFAESSESYVRLSHATGRWMIWDGSKWRADRSTVREAIRRICRSAAAAASESSGAVRLASAAKVMAVEALARSDARLTVDDERWDANPWLLNTLGGAIDLVTGCVHPHDPDLLMTRMSAASAEGHSPRWRDFMETVTEGDAELQGYLQRVAGYCLTGSTREHAMFFLLGSGSNGKSVFTTVLRTILGDYAVAAASDLLTATNLARHPTELAALRNVRLVLVAEVERRSRFAESRMKSLTGGDQIAARLMRQDFSTFTPQFKLIITGNQMPAMDGVDEAVRRRLHIIPFGRTIKAQDRDLLLTDRLLAERNGILSWALQGCLDWQRDGLNPPRVVTDASGLYLDSQDNVGQFITSCCDVGRDFSSGSTDLFRVWSAWARQRSEQPGSQRAFVQELTARGFPTRRTAQLRIIAGIRLKAETAGAGERS